MEKEDEQQLNVQGTEPDVRAEAEQKRSIGGVVEAAVQDYDYFQLVLTFLFYLQTLGTLFFPDVELGLWEDAFGWIGSFSLNLDINFDNDKASIAVIELTFLFPLWLCFELRELIYYLMFPRKNMHKVYKILTFIIISGLITQICLAVKKETRTWIFTLAIPYLLILASGCLRLSEKVLLRTDDYSSERKKRNRIKLEDMYGGYLCRILLLIFKLSLVPMAISCGEVFQQSKHKPTQILALIASGFLAFTIFGVIGALAYAQKLFKSGLGASLPIYINSLFRHLLKQSFAGSDVWFYPLLELLDKLLLAVNSLIFEDIKGVYVAIGIITVTGFLSAFLKPYDTKSLEADMLSRISNLIVLILIITNETSKSDISMFMVIITAATLVYWGFRINLKGLIQRLFTYATFTKQYCVNCVFQVEVWNSKGLESFSKIMKRYTYMDSTRWEMLSASQQMFYLALKTPNDPPKSVVLPTSAPTFYGTAYKVIYTLYGFYSLQTAEVFRLIGRITKKEDLGAFIHSSEMFSYMPKLLELKVSTVKFHDDTKFLFQSIAEHSTLLWRLELESCSLEKVDVMLFAETFQKCTSISDFIVRSCKISENAMSNVLRSVAASKHLKYFSVKEMVLPCDSLLEVFPEFALNSSLASLSLSKNSFNVAGNCDKMKQVRKALLSTVAKMPVLKEAYFPGWETTDPLPSNVEFVWESE